MSKDELMAYHKRRIEERGINDIEIMVAVKRGHCLMEWDVGRFMEIIKK